MNRCAQHRQQSGPRRCFSVLTLASILALAVASAGAQCVTANVTLNPGPTATWMITPLGSGQRVPAFDAYLEVQILDCSNNPIAGYPFQDIWIGGCAPSNVSLCTGGLTADTNTNANGETTIGLSSPMSGGGWSLQSQLIVGGAAAGGCLDLRINSPDIDGDHSIDVADLGLWAADAQSARLNAGVMPFRSDLYPEGTLGLLDYALLMRHFGEVGCP